MRKGVRIRRPHRFRKKKSILKNRYFWFFVLILIGAATLFYFLVFSEIFQVKKIIITGERKISTKELKLLVEKKIENKILFFKTKSIFLINKNEIRKDILDHFPPIAEVEITRGFPDVLNILVVERVESAIWCKNDNCFLIDNEGIIFEKTQERPDLIKIINKQKMDSLALGDEIIKKELMSKILKIKSQLQENLKILLTEASVVSNERVNAKTSEGWEIYLNPAENLDWQLQKLNLVLEQKIPSEKREELEYIDLRFGDRAYFKYRD